MAAGVCVCVGGKDCWKWRRQAGRQAASLKQLGQVLSRATGQVKARERGRHSSGISPTTSRRGAMTNLHTQLQMGGVGEWVGALLLTCVAELMRT